MQEFHQFPATSLKAVQRPQNMLKLAQWQAHHRAQIRDHPGESYPNASLSQYLFAEVHRRFMPSLATRTPPFVNPMLRHFHHWRRRHIDHFAATGQTDAAQAQMTVRTRHDAMLDDLRGH